MLAAVVDGYDFGGELPVEFLLICGEAIIGRVERDEPCVVKASARSETDIKSKMPIPIFVTTNSPVSFRVEELHRGLV